jgi:hypothetical protein
MSALVLTGEIVANRPTKGGKWHRVMVAGSGRVNDLVMVPADVPAALAEPGDTISLGVRPSVETTAEGRPTKNIVYFLAD